MSHKKQPFIIDNNLKNPRIKEYLPRDSKTTVELGLRPNALDNLDVVDICARKAAILVTADTGFPLHFRDYQKSTNDCCWGLMLLPDGIEKQLNVLQKLKDGKIKLTHPKLETFNFESARHDNLFINLRANPPQIGELCDCKWGDDL